MNKRFGTIEKSMKCIGFAVYFYLEMVYDHVNKKQRQLNFGSKKFHNRMIERITMKKAFLALICLMILSSPAMAQDPSGFGLSLGYGQSTDSIDIYRVGLLKKWGVKWLQNSTGYVDGYFELSYNRWEYGGDKINGIALSPVFMYAFNPNDSTWYPYIEGGIGVTYLDEYFIKDRDLSSNFQFEDRIGVGFRFDSLDVNFRYMHYSNASLKQPNDGIDIWIGTLAWYF